MDGERAPAGGDACVSLLGLYDAALPHVYGYLLRRCGGPEVAEELTSETFLAAVDSARRSPPPALDVAWLIGVARHKLADHWRRTAREERKLRAVATDPTVTVDSHDPWDVRLDAVRARDTLDRLSAQHRAVLTLRYLDDLPVAEVAGLLERTVQATEALLTRAKRAFRTDYDTEPPHTEGEGVHRV